MRSTCPEFRKMKIEKSTNIFQNVDRIPILSSDFRCHPSPIAAVPEGPEGLCARKSQTVRQSVQVLGVKNGRNLGRSTFLHFENGRFEKNENMIFEKVDLKNRVLVETKTFRHIDFLPVPSTSGVGSRGYGDEYRRPVPPPASTMDHKHYTPQFPSRKYIYR